MISTAALETLMSSSYKAAVDTLNLYQVKAGANSVAKKQTAKLLEGAERFFVRTGHSVEELNQLNVIHVAGTKGKGSVCALCESVLRQCGLRTGLVTSPHLLEVRERIKIDGRSLTHDLFAHYFWECFNKLDSSKKSELNMPSYYRLLTLVAFHVFLEEKVDVAIVEVGKGGAYDTTNIIQHPVVCGITVLDLDHTAELGDSLEAIAWHKAGISKPDHPLITHPQLHRAMEVITQQARERQVSSIEVAPHLCCYPGKEVVLGLSGRHNQYNASLAVQICKKWLTLKGLWSGRDSDPGDTVVVRRELCGTPEAPPFQLTQQFRDGLRECCWPGRCHVERRGGVTFYLDSAHTPLSMEACVQWFNEEADKEKAENVSVTVRVLLFNFIGHRDPKALLAPLLSCNFDYAMFAPSFTGADGSNTADQLYRKTSPEAQYKSSCENERIWQELIQQLITPSPDSAEDRRQCDIIITRHPSDTIQQTCVFPSLDHAIHWCCAGRGWSVQSTAPRKLGEVKETPRKLKNAPHIQVLVTGSVRLIGTTMFILNCSLS